MKKSKRFCSFLIAGLMLGVSSFCSFAGTTTDIYNYPNVIDKQLQADEEGANYYVFGLLDKRWNGISATIDLPSRSLIEYKNTNEWDGRCAYISFGVYGHNANGNERGYDIGLKREANANVWHVYFGDLNSGVNQEKFINLDYSGTITMDLRTKVVGGQSKAVLSINGSEVLTRNIDITNNGKLVYNQFYRFVSLVPKIGSGDNNDGSYLRGVGFRNLTAHVYTNLNSRTPSALDWSVFDYDTYYSNSNYPNVSTIVQAFEVFPDYIGVHDGAGTSEYINISHITGSEN